MKKDDVLLTTREVSRLLGVKQDRLNFLAHLGLLQPTGYVNGSSQRMTFSPTDVIVTRVVDDMRRRGHPKTMTNRASRLIRCGAKFLVEANGSIEGAPSATAALRMATCWTAANLVNVDALRRQLAERAENQGTAWS